MPADVLTFGAKPAVSDVHILWITAGLSCDGDSVSVTAAEQPSLEDVVMGAIPGLPKVHLHNPVLAYEVGDDFMKYFYQAERGELEPFVLVVEAPFRTKPSRTRAIGPRWAPIPIPVSPSLPVSGLIVSPPKPWP